MQHRIIEWFGLEQTFKDNLHAELLVGPHESGVEGQNPLPHLAGHASSEAAQDMVGLLGHVELLINQHPQVLLLRAALNPFSAQPVFVLGIALTHVQDLAHGLVEPHEVRTGPALKPVQVPLDDIPSLQRVDRTTQLGVICRFAEGALNPSSDLLFSGYVQQHKKSPNQTKESVVSYRKFGQL